MSLVSNIAARAAAAISRPPALAGLELLASAVVVLDCDGRIVYANAAAENLLESSLKALSRQTLSALFLNTEELDHICAQAREHKFSDLRQDLMLERAGRDPLHVHSIVSALEPACGVLIELRETSST
jgi:two-component system nitrogen regulation sensor histidine kinase GlnL